MKRCANPMRQRVLRRDVLKKSVVVSGLVLGALGLSACASSPPPPMCPNIIIPEDGSKLTRFKPGPGRDIIDVLHEEKITGFAHGCKYNTDDTGAGELTVYVAPLIESSRGPANAKNLAEFEYFIAVVDKNNTVIEKKNFPASLVFPENISLVKWRIKTPKAIKIPLKSGQEGTDFKLYIGLQLTRAELDYVRRKR